MRAKKPVIQVRPKLHKTKLEELYRIPQIPKDLVS